MCYFLAAASGSCCGPMMMSIRVCVCFQDYSVEGMSDSLLTFLQHLREFGLVFQRKASGYSGVGRVGEPVQSDLHPRVETRSAVCVHDSISSSRCLSSVFLCLGQSHLGHEDDCPPSSLPSFCLFSSEEVTALLSHQTGHHLGYWGHQQLPAHLCCRPSSWFWSWFWFCRLRVHCGGNKLPNLRLHK